MAKSIYVFTTNTLKRFIEFGSDLMKINEINRIPQIIKELSLLKRFVIQIGIFARMILLWL